MGDLVPRRLGQEGFFRLIFEFKKTAIGYAQGKDVLVEAFAGGGIGEAEYAAFFSFLRFLEGIEDGLSAAAAETYPNVVLRRLIVIGQRDRDSREKPRLRAIRGVSLHRGA